jgi:RND superfamily putative drug exporter
LLILKVVLSIHGLISSLTNYATDNVPAGVNVSFTGIHFFQDDILAGAKSDVKHMDSIVLPLALIILALVLGNLPIMIIPLFTIASATFLSAIVMYPVALLMQVTQFTQSLMSSLVISMSIDYSLFLLARCIEELSRQRASNTGAGNGSVAGHHVSVVQGRDETKRDAIATMLEFSGHTIIASGVTLCCCFLGLLFLPLAMLRSVGVGSSVAILSALFVNLSLVPAILHTCIGSHMLRPNKCFSILCCSEVGSPGRSKPRHADRRSDDAHNGLDEALIRCREEDGDDETVEYVELLSANSRTGIIGGEGTILELKNDHIDLVRMKRSLWYKFGEILVHPLKGGCILAVVLALVIPIALYYPQCGSSIAFEPMLPADSISKQTFDRLGSEFGAGSLFPFRIIFDGRETKTHTDTATSFQAIQSVVRELSGAEFPATHNVSSFTSIATLGGYFVPHWFYEASVLCGPNCWFETMRTVESMRQQLNAPHNMTTYAQAILTLDPNSKEGTQWLLDARNKIQNMTLNGSLNNLTVHLEGGSGVEYDAVKAVFDHVPMMIGITLSVVFVLMGLFFRSIVVPIRSVVTISLTQAFVFGLAVLVYQHGALDFLGVRALSYANEISWLPPVISFCVMVGLGLDYDVFLSSRVLEYRLKGLNDRSSILVGLYKTGRIITAAGVIMAVAFGGLFGSTSLILNETAFLLTAAVLMDTFVTRTVVMPILMNLTAKFNWWPRKLPRIRFDVTRR